MNSASVFVFQNTHQGFKTQKKHVNMYCKTQISFSKHGSGFVNINLICDLPKLPFVFSSLTILGVPVGFVFCSFAFPKHVFGFTKHKAEKYLSVFGNTNQVLDLICVFPLLLFLDLICVLDSDLCFVVFAF